MNLQAPSSVKNLLQQAILFFRRNDFNQATAACESFIEENPESGLGYWYLGLIYLLQDQQSETELVWMMAMAEEPDQIAQQTLELLQVLEEEATQRTTTQDYQSAWAIRQSIRAIAPADITNLLHIVQLSVELEQLTLEDLAEMELVNLLREQPSQVDSDLLWQVIKQLLDRLLEELIVFELVEVSLRYADNPDVWIEVLLAKAVILGRLLRKSTMARRYGELCLRLDPQHSETLLRLSSFYQDEGSYAEGIEMARRYFSGCQTPLQKVVGNALVLRGLMMAGAKWQEAETALHEEFALVRSFIASHEINPDQLLDASFACMPMFFSPYFSDRPDEARPLQNQLLELYQKTLHAFVEQHVEDYQPYPTAALKRSHKLTSGSLSKHRPLRIGYLSRYMLRHSIGWLCRWVFQHFDRDRFDVYAYFNHHPKIDAFSQRWFASNATQACCFTGDAFGIARAIQDDEIDILVDLDSITADYTCSVMALKPAPIQVTWLGLDATGLPAIDYFIADPYVLPNDAQDYYSERIWRLPQTYIAVDGFEVGVPNLRRADLGIPADAIVYLSAQSAYKRHPETIRMQMQIIKEVSNSYFLIKGTGDREGLQSLFEQIAEEEGVGRDRLRFLPLKLYEENHRANLQIADVVLDTYPYSGATTTLETLWMGIPLVTRVGQQFAARNSYTMMVNAGITEGVAWTDDEYVEWGVRLGEDAALRDEISWKLRRSRQTAPLWNGKQFTRDLEQAYEQMWKIYQENL